MYRAQGARHKEKIHSVCLFLPCTLYPEPWAVLLGQIDPQGPDSLLIELNSGLCRGTHEGLTFAAVDSSNELILEMLKDWIIDSMVHCRAISNKIPSILLDRVPSGKFNESGPTLSLLAFSHSLKENTWVG